MCDLVNAQTHAMTKFIPDPQNKRVPIHTMFALLKSTAFQIDCI